MERLKTVGWALMCLAFAGLFAWLWGADLVRELAHRNDTFADASDIRLVEGRCKSKLFVVSSCDMKLRDAGGRQTEQSYFLLGNYGGASVSVVRSVQDPTFVTTSMGRDQLWNRVLLTLAPIGAFGLGGLVLLKRAATG